MISQFTLIKPVKTAAYYVKSLRILWYKMRIRNQAMETVSALCMVKLTFKFQTARVFP